jgi:hypothetical protein
MHKLTGTNGANELYVMLWISSSGPKCKLIYDFYHLMNNKDIWKNKKFQDQDHNGIG